MKPGLVAAQQRTSAAYAVAKRRGAVELKGLRERLKQRLPGYSAAAQHGFAQKKPAPEERNVYR
jgi:hypothetical protein